MPGPQLSCDSRFRMRRLRGDEAFGGERHPRVRGYFHVEVPDVALELGDRPHSGQNRRYGRVPECELERRCRERNGVSGTDRADALRPLQHRRLDRRVIETRAR